VSGYLMRSIMRTRAADAGQLIQPFVRSTSPVAEQDQRIGLMGMEGFEFGEASFSEAASEAGLEQYDALQAPGLSSITAASLPEGVTVQRKMASLADPITPGSTTGGALIPSIVRQKVTDHATPSSPSTSITEQTSAPQDAVPLLDPPMTGESPVALGTPSFSQPGSAQIREALRHSALADVRSRPAQRVRQVDTTRLEPSARTFAAQVESRPTDASMPTAGANESPRVVIGRINVEVIQPPAAPPSTATPRPGPMTAASASVIGPLSGGVRANLHLSLRHR
jgi:hypothetical protein